MAPALNVKATLSIGDHGSYFPDCRCVGGYKLKISSQLEIHILDALSEILCFSFDALILSHYSGMLRTDFSMSRASHGKDGVTFISG